LMAQGETIIEGVHQIDRGYARIEQRLGRLGADIQRINE
jgi:UDP-N-acetylglucosamine 1-carboxyvinyltransferase